jgi:sugar transferase (PEP-CTERM system associated)
MRVPLLRWSASRGTGVLRGPAFSSTAGALFALDVVLSAPAWTFAALRLDPGAAARGRLGFVIAAVAAFLCWLLFLYALGLYRRDAMLALRLSIARTPLVAGMAGVVAWMAAAGICAAFEIERPPGAAWQAALFAVSIVCFVLCGTVARLGFAVLVEAHAFHRRLLVVGAGQRARDLLGRIRAESSAFQDEVMFVHHPMLGERLDLAHGAPGCTVVDAPDFNILDLATHYDVHQIVIAPDERRGMPLENLLECKKAGFPIVEYLSFIERETRRIDLQRLELGWVLYSDGFTFGLLDRFLKRLFDLMTSLFILVVTAPFVAVAMAAIRLEGRGPVLYRQERITRDGLVFEVLKLRTMQLDAEAGGAVWAGVNDARVTRVGRFLRRSRIDELPQLFNVLRGDMSIVGPRPERSVFVADLAREIPLYNERHMVKAGLTGWAQVNYPYGASVEDARNKLSFDLYYVKNFSILLDVLILAQTVRVLFWPSGVR